MQLPSQSHPFASFKELRGQSRPTVYHKNNRRPLFETCVLSAQQSVAIHVSQKRWARSVACGRALLQLPIQPRIVVGDLSQN